MTKTSTTPNPGEEPPPVAGPQQLTVTPAGGGSGVVTSTPAGISCPGTCTAKFPQGTQVGLAATPDANFLFGGWGGSCAGTGSCSVTLNASTSVTATFMASLQSINHIIFMAQENRGFLHYFGAMKQYWAAHNFPPQAFDGWTQFDSPGAPAETSLGCDPAITTECAITANSPAVPSFHLVTQCIENMSPSWNESHVDWNVHDPYFPAPAMDGFIREAAQHARSLAPALSDVNGLRAMGFYTDTDLPYYYFMASEFATSDRWFSPVMTRTQPNRMYLMAGTSAGHAYPLATGTPQLTNKTIFESLQDAGISWKVYVTDDQFGSLPPHTELGGFTFANSHGSNFVSAKQFFKDLDQGTLPTVAEIDPGFALGLDEHAGEDDGSPSGKVQAGAHYVSTLINALMQSQYWKDSVFILTWDEFGGFYDHLGPDGKAPPQPMVSPDLIAPTDLKTDLTVTPPSYDICADPSKTGPTCDFVYTGYRVPLIVVSPFTKKNYVSHTVADYTAILKFIETRFGLTSLTNRDAAQMDMTEFFDFVNIPWKTPPSPPDQPNTAPCYLDHLP